PVNPEVTAMQKSATADKPASPTATAASGSPPSVPSTGSPPSDRADLRPENINDAVIRLAGNSQDGIQTAGAFLARLAGRSDQDVMTYMTIPATTSAGPSIFCQPATKPIFWSRFSNTVIKTISIFSKKAASSFTIWTTSSRTWTTNV